MTARSGWFRRGAFARPQHSVGPVVGYRPALMATRQAQRSQSLFSYAKLLLEHQRPLIGPHLWLGPRREARIPYAR
jgi:hypothetical protein